MSWWNDAWNAVEKAWDLVTGPDRAIIAIEALYGVNVRDELAASAASLNR